MKSDNGNVHRAAANIIVSKSRAARGSVCNVLLSDASNHSHQFRPKWFVSAGQEEVQSRAIERPDIK